MKIVPEEQFGEQDLGTSLSHLGEQLGAKLEQVSGLAPAAPELGLGYQVPQVEDLAEKLRALYPASFGNQLESNVRPSLDQIHANLENINNDASSVYGKQANEEELKGKIFALEKTISENHNLQNELSSSLNELGGLLKQRREIVVQKTKEQATKDIVMEKTLLEQIDAELKVLTDMAEKVKQSILVNENIIAENGAHVAVPPLPGAIPLGTTNAAAHEAGTGPAAPGAVAPVEGVAPAAGAVPAVPGAAPAVGAEAAAVHPAGAAPGVHPAGAEAVPGVHAAGAEAVPGALPGALPVEDAHPAAPHPAGHTPI